MGEAKFKKLKMELAVVQSHMFIVDDDRPRVLRAMNGLGIADEMYSLLEAINDGDIDYIEGGKMFEGIEQLLAKARGEG